MKSLLKLSPSLLILWIFFSGCSPEYYAPNSHNVPLLEEKGEGDVSLIAGDGRAEVQGAYAVSNNIGVMLNGAFFKPKDDEQGDGGAGNQLEAGAGYFRSISNHVVFETYGLLGFGGLENHFPSTADSTSSGNIEANLVRYGIQPAVGFKSKYFDAAVSMRLAGVSYFNVSGDLKFEGVNQVHYLQYNSFQFLAEPALTIRGGYQFVKLQFQIGTSYNLTKPTFRQQTGYMTGGLVFLIDK